MTNVSAPVPAHSRGVKFQSWISIPVSIIRDRGFIFLDPVERAAWFADILRCVENDLGGEAAGIYRGAEIFAASLRLSYKEGPGSYRVRRWRRIKAARAIATHTEEEWLALLESLGRKCLRCGSTENIQKDHVVPVTRGGSDGIGNLQPLCKPCNTSKGTKAADYRRRGNGR